MNLILDILGIKLNDDYHKSLFNNSLLIKRRPSIIKCSSNIYTRYSELIQSFYDKKNLVLKSQSSSSAYFNVNTIIKYIKEKDNENNWYSTEVEPRYNYPYLYYNKQMQLFKKSNLLLFNINLLDSSITNYKIKTNNNYPMFDAINSLACLAFTYLAIKYNLQENLFQNFFSYDNNQYYLILKGFIGNKAYLDYIKTLREIIHKQYKYTDTHKNSNMLDMNTINILKDTIDDANYNIMPFKNTEHIIVLYKNNYWKVDIIENYGKFVSILQIIIDYDSYHNKNILIDNNNVNLFGLLYSTIEMNNNNTNLTREFTNLSKDNYKFINYLKNSLLIVKLEDYLPSNNNINNVNIPSKLRDSVLHTMSDKNNNISSNWFSNYAYINKLSVVTVFRDGSICFNTEKCIDSSCAYEISNLHNTIIKYFTYLTSSLNNVDIVSKYSYNKHFKQLDFDSTFLESINKMLKKMYKNTKKININNICSKMNMYNLVENKQTTNNEAEYTDVYYTPLKLITYNLSDNLKNIAIKEYKNKDTHLFNNVNIVKLCVYKFGNTILKSKLLNPEAFLQMVIISALYRYNGELVSFCERVSTRNLLNGGIEFLRINNKISNSFALSMTLENIPYELKIKLGDDAMNEYIKAKILVKNGLSLKSMTNVINKCRFKKFITNKSNFNLDNDKLSFDKAITYPKTIYNNNNNINKNMYINNNSDNLDKSSKINIDLENKNFDFKSNKDNKEQSNLNSINYYDMSKEEKAIDYMINNYMFNFIEKITYISQIETNNNLDINLYESVFPPEIKKGISISTIINNDNILITINSITNNKAFLKKLAETIIEILDEMKELFINNYKAKF